MGYHRSTFGIGFVVATATTANPTPQNIAIIKSWNVDFASTEKPLMGNKLFAVDSATTAASIKGKIQTSDFDSRMVSMVIPGTSRATGTTIPASQSTVIPTTPFQITVTNSATFAHNLGVVDLTSARVLEVVASAPATGQYSFSAGVYTFAAADAGHTVSITYDHTSTAGITTTGSNPTSGATTPFGLRVYDPEGGTRSTGLYFPAVKFSNLSLGMKIDDWTESSIDFEAFEDDYGIPFYTFGNE